MTIKDTIIERDLRHIWHPCSQMKDYEVFRPLEIDSAKGSVITLKEGRKMIDAISSWWCKSLGHNHPRLKNALMRQMEKFEHVILANTTHPTIVTLSEKLAQLTTSLNKVFYASDGSSAIEVAMKMSIHARLLEANPKRHRFMALSNGYHGETLGALSVSDVGIYKEPYAKVLMETSFISPLPYVATVNDPSWQSCEQEWEEILPQLERYAETTTAVLVEPILQGAGGMKIYSQDFLKRLRTWTRENNIHLIADEIMTGIGRTGRMLACEHANIEPDFLCVSKGLTSGWLPLSAVLTHQKIFDLFYDDYAAGKSFLHSHTFSGNALAASVAVEVLAIMAEEKICQKADELGRTMYLAMQEIADETRKITNVRSIGAMVAADIICDDPTKRSGFKFYQQAVQLGALIRPLNNTIYWLPPLNTHLEMVAELKRITQLALIEL